MLGLGLASSHAPAMFEPKERWPLVYSRSRIPEYTKESQPHTAKLETPEVIQGYIDRIHAAFDVLRQQLEAYQPEALIVVGDDQGDMFDASNNPTTRHGIICRVLYGRGAVGAGWHELSAAGRAPQSDLPLPCRTRPRYPQGADQKRL